MIEGVIIQELKKIADDRGKVMHMLRSDSTLFTKFGEIYFSVVNPQCIKAWKRHLKMTQHFAVPVGNIRLVLYDERKDSVTFGKVAVLDVGQDNYCLVRIPPLVWYGFQSTLPSPALIANCTDLPHDPGEVDRVDVLDGRIPYRWEE